jgi:hypothetical protein
MPALADTATWIAVGFAVGAAVLAFAASVGVLVLVFRRGRSVSDAPDAGSGEAPAHAPPDARPEDTRSRRLSEIATTIDLDLVLEETLAAAVAADGVDAAWPSSTISRTLPSSPRWA